MSFKILTANALVVNDNRIIINLRDKTKEFSIKLDNIEGEVIFPTIPNESVRLMYDGDQTLNGSYTFTSTVSGVDPVQSDDFVTKGYLESVITGSSSRYFQTGDASFTTSGGMVAAVNVVAPVGTYLVSIRGVFRNNDDSGSILQTFHVEILSASHHIIEGPVTLLTDDGQLELARTSVTKTLPGFSINAGGITAGWKILYEIAAI